MKNLSALIVAAALTATPTVPVSRETACDPIVEWSNAASAAAEASRMPALRTPFTLAILHLAMYDAVNAITGERQPYAVSPPVTHPASAHAAAIEAGYRVLLAEFPGQAQT